jgi:hypothetical protein
LEGRNEKERKSNYKMRAERVTKFHRSPERDVNSHSHTFNILSSSIMNLGLENNITSFMRFSLIPVRQRSNYRSR